MRLLLAVRSSSGYQRLRLARRPIGRVQFPIKDHLLKKQGPMQWSEIFCPFRIEKLILPPSVASPLTLLLPFVTETLTEALADFDPARALAKLEPDAVPPPLALTWADAETDTFPARAVCEYSNVIITDTMGPRRIFYSHSKCTTSPDKEWTRLRGRGNLTFVRK